MPTDLTPATTIRQAEAHQCCLGVVQIFSAYHLLKQEVVMLHIIADIIVRDVQLVKLQTRREKAGKDSRLHKPEQNKQVSLKLG